MTQNVSQAGALPVVAGVELGGTKCICILGTGPDDIKEIAEHPTTDPAATLAAIAATLSGWRDRHGAPQALGIASFGPLQIDPARPDYGHILATPKPGWSGAAVAPFLASVLGVPVVVDTDVNGAALAEGRWGAARGLANHAYVTVGTGVGVGLVCGGRPVAGFTHTELGHVRVVRAEGDDWPGACPFHGACVEGLASGPAIAARVGFSPARLQPDDPVWRSVAHALAQLAHIIVLAAAPSRIVMGGGVIGAQPHLLPLVSAMLETSLNAYGATDRLGTELAPYLVAPALGRMAGPLGALALALTANG